jgi:FkbM family methyltransferase
MKSQFIRRILSKVGRKFGYQIIDTGNPVDLLLELERYRIGGNLRTGNDDVDFFKYLIGNFSISHSQLFQDLFVLYRTHELRGGFFVEFGGTDGLSMSNTFLLEKDYEWNGIVSEPARIWHPHLRHNRECTIDTRCVWRSSGEKLEFNETSEGALSTIDSFSSSDGHSESRRHGTKYDVETVSLNDLLLAHRAPLEIDYLSVDTEGSEFSILSEFDFSKWNVKIISVEHNYTLSRSKIASLLNGWGYISVLENFSRWDDWYIKVT